MKHPAPSAARGSKDHASTSSLKFLFACIVGGSAAVNLGATVYLYEVAFLALGCVYMIGGRKAQPEAWLLIVSALILAARIAIFESFDIPDTLNWIGTYLFVAFVVYAALVFLRGSLERSSDLAMGIYLGVTVGLIAGLSSVMYYSSQSLGTRLFYGAPVVIFLLAIWLFPKRNFVSIILMACAAIGFLATGDRGRAISVIVPMFAMLVWLFRGRRGQIDRRPGGASSFVLLILFGISLSTILVGVTELLDQSGVLPDRAASKFSRQSGSGVWELLLNARPDTPGLVTAIAERPLMGYGVEGPQGRDAARFVLANEQTASLSEDKKSRFIDRGLVLHSGLLGAWVRFGLVSILFWLPIIYWALLAMPAYFFNKSRYSILVIYASTSLIFTAFFEPGRNRVDLGMNILVVLAALHAVKFAKSRGVPLGAANRARASRANPAKINSSSKDRCFRPN